MSRSPNVSWIPYMKTSNSTVEDQNKTDSGDKKHDLSDTKENSKDSGGKKRRFSSKSVQHKPSGSMTTGNWLGWASKTAPSDPQKSEDDNENEHDDNYKDNDEYDDYGVNDGNADDNEGEVEVEDSKSRKKSGSWTFWNSNESEGAGGNGNNNNDNKDKKEKPSSIANMIVSSTPSIPTKQDLLGDGSGHRKADKANEDDTSQQTSGQDDAVLYKPHDKSSQFNQINTHKNENLKENIIVPDWNSCLPTQSSSLNSSITSSIFGNFSTSNTNNNQSTSVDLKNWRNFLSQLSSKLGFSSGSLASVVTNDENNDDKTPQQSVEREFNLLYEKTYRLYGKSLQKLPPHKRACLPNYNRAYSAGHTSKNQLEEDSKDPNSITISNDPLGNLIINQRPSQSVQSPVTVSQSAKPLRRIRKILIIGVHGFFPTRMIRPIIGTPKGTSLKFANEAEKSVIRYCVENNMIDENDVNSISIQKIALEKEGKIFDRVDFFTKILQKWSDELNDSDFIFMASHSQGCVVSIILLAKLISMGVLKNPTAKRIGILGMAGINNGPFYGIDKSFLMKAYSAIEHESLAELFEFTKFDSKQSLVYKDSVQMIINANVKLCFIGSINDQLVPLYSALASHIYHPNIYRACYIDHSSQTPLFIQKLVSLCCQLQNLGYFDNNVLKELSTSLTGSMTGGGHSKIYNDGKVYDLGIKFVLDTDDIVIPAAPANVKGKQSPEATLPSIPSESLVTTGFGTYGTEGSNETVMPVTNQVYIREYNVGKIGSNPFILPWCLRGLLFNIEKNWPNNNKLLMVDNGKDLGRNGYDEINELYELFEAWRPDSKVLKELKFRLNGLRASKL